MNSIENDYEMKKIYEWATQNNIQCNEKYLSSCESMFHEFENEGNIVEYGFDSMTELKDRIVENLDISESEELATCCAVAAYKRKKGLVSYHEENTLEKDINIGQQERLPDYIYVF